MKLIFLDFDGVLNTHTFLSKQKNHQPDNIVFPDLASQLDPKRIELVNSLVSNTGAQVIISSSWRTEYSVDEMNSVFISLGATFNISGATPRIYGNQNLDERGNEIQAYMDALKEKPEKFVILDDETDMGHLFPFLVKTSFFLDGLTEYHIEKAKEMLL